MPLSVCGQHKKQATWCDKTTELKWAYMFKNY